ncbi:MAG: FAD-dependent oxidoreductase [Pseudomonadota bacterium]
MGKHLVLAGGGHAHMVTLSNIKLLRDLGHTVTVIGPSDYHYYSGMGPGMLGATYEPDNIRFATRKTVEEQGGTFIRDSITAVDPVARRLHLASGRIIDYDVVSFNTGSSVDLPEIIGDASTIYTVKPIERLYEARRQIKEKAMQQSVAIAVIGGGPAGAEVAGNVRQLVSASGHKVKISLFAGHQFMSRFPENVRSRSHDLLEKNGVIIHEYGYLKTIKDNTLIFDCGITEHADFIILATGVHPSSFFRQAGIATGPEGGLLVNRYLQSPEHPEIFGGGDCISFEPQPLDKVGVYAVRENPILFHNLKAYLQGEELIPFDPGGDYLLIFNLGNGQGVLRKKWLIFAGHLAFLIKDWIDKKFMTKFKKDNLLI